MTFIHKPLMICFVIFLKVLSRFTKKGFYFPFCRKKNSPKSFSMGLFHCTDGVTIIRSSLINFSFVYRTLSGFWIQRAILVHKWTGFYFILFFFLHASKFFLKIYHSRFDTQCDKRFEEGMQSFENGNSSRERNDQTVLKG